MRSIRAFCGAFLFKKHVMLSKMLKLLKIILMINMVQAVWYSVLQRLGGHCISSLVTQPARL